MFQKATTVRSHSLPSDCKRFLTVRTRCFYAIPIRVSDTASSDGEPDDSAAVPSPVRLNTL